jgi:hypothetical protein
LTGRPKIEQCCRNVQSCTRDQAPAAVHSESTLHIILLGDRINGRDITFGGMGYVIVKGKGVLSIEAAGPATNGPGSAHDTLAFHAP